MGAQQLPGNFMSVLKGTGASPTESSLMANAFSFVLGGYETTSLLLAQSLHFLAFHPQVQARMSVEARQVDLSTDVDVMKQAPYILAVAKEVQRLVPQLPLNSKVLTEDVDLRDIGGPMLIKGTAVLTLAGLS